jgi:transmembrane sensor
MRHRNRQLEELHAAQASAWVEAMRNPSPKDDSDFIDWLKESPRNVRDFLLMYGVDAALDELDHDRRRDVHALIASVERRVTPLGAIRTAAPGLPTRRRAWQGLVTASVLMAAALGWWMWPRGASDWKSFETATGEQRAFELDDGSVVHLNTHSRAAIRFSKTARDVRLLEGEALFRVHHDTARPFRVYTDDAVVRAVGTQFDVYKRSGDTVIAVIEGTVNIAPAPPKASGPPGVKPSPRGGSAGGRTGTASPDGVAGRNLGASQEADVSSAGLVSVRALPDVSDTVAWRDRRLVFRQQTLEHIVEEFNRYSRRQIRLDGAGVTDRVYSGVFDIDDTDSLAQVLARDPDLVVEQSAGSVVVKHR